MEIGRGKHSSKTDLPSAEVEFDFQWANLPSPQMEYNKARVAEFLELVKLPDSFFKGKICLDAGCGVGRWTYAMQELGARVVSIDVSKEAVRACRTVNANARVADILDLPENRIHDFVLSWGVLHHLSDPRLGFTRVASQVKKGGTLHVMMYHRDMQKTYEEGRRLWPNMTHEQRLKYSREMAEKTRETWHGWWDALNPKYNSSYIPEEIRKWFEEEGFSEVTLTKEHNINMRGIYSGR